MMIYLDYSVNDDLSRVLRLSSSHHYCVNDDTNTLSIKTCRDYFVNDHMSRLLVKDDMSHFATILSIMIYRNNVVNDHMSRLFCRCSKYIGNFYIQIHLNAYM